MFFIVSKILAFLTVPILWILVLFLFTIFSENPKRKKKLLIWTFITFYLFSNSFLLDECMRRWEIPAISPNSINEPYDAGIVLGGVISYDPTIDRFQFQRQGDRIMQAVILYKKGKIRKILFSGGAGDINEPENKEGPQVKSFLLTIGIPEADILIEGESRNTRQNAFLTSVLLNKTYHNGRFLLITSATHERRALKCFEKVGVNVTPYSVDRYTGPNRYFSFDHMFVPSAGTLLNWEALTHELIGIVIYKVMGYI